MHANNPLLRSRKDTVFLLSLLRDHPAFHDATALREKKDALSGATPLLLGTTAPVYAFMTVDFLIHRFFAGLTGLSEDEYRELALDFFDGANLGIMEVLSLIYLQNAASLPRVDQRREAFLKRRNLVSQVGVFIPEMDE